MNTPTVPPAESPAEEAIATETPTQDTVENEDAADPGTGESAAEDAAATETQAQDTVESEDAVGTVTVESVRTLPEVAGESDPWFASLSLDGAYLVYYTEEGRGRNRTG